MFVVLFVVVVVALSRRRTFLICSPSSIQREPSQVFTLLETIYHEFDQVAKQRRVFKVETVGDCCKYLETKTKCCIMDASLMLVSHSGLL